MTASQTLPKYIQVSEMLIRDIMAGRLNDGERLAPERVMAADLGISVGTLRKALNDMQQKGVLERRQGSGNYILASGEIAAIYSFFRIELLGGGGLPTARIISVDRLKKPITAPNFGPSSNAFRIRRIRSLNNIPSVMEEIWLDGDQASALDANSLGDSLYLYYRTALNLWITKVEDRIKTNVMPDWHENDFELPSSPCVCVERVSYAQNGNPVEYSLNWIDGTVANYIARIG